MKSWMPGFPQYLQVKIFLFLALCMFLNGCHSRDIYVPPTIEFTKIPAEGSGGPDKLDVIEGHVKGARPDQQIVLFARAGTWWVQPMSDQPFTRIQSDSSWKSSTHFGTEYAALLVDPGYRPPAKIDTLPGVGGGIAAVATVKGGHTAAKTFKTIQFSGYEWKIRDTLGERNGSPHENDPANVTVDSNGFLHLHIGRGANKWSCSEVIMTRSLGYGTYLFSVQDVSHLEPAAVFSMFTWDELGTEQNHREMDIEISRWGELAEKNAQYVIQPYYVPANVARFAVPPGLLTFSFHWEPGKASFETVRGITTASGSHPIAAHVFTSDIPSQGGESIRMNMCPFEFSKIPMQNPAEIVVERVQYFP